ncbi:hypothetical protein A5740_17460 [Mycobacterium sp. GA-1841]|nr:hypothetical protein A5740_17460 [Mycobacterium sp. GA-1841]
MRPVCANWILRSNPDRLQNEFMGRTWLFRLAGKYRRAFTVGNRASTRDVDARRVRSELDAIRVRFPDHA